VETLCAIVTVLVAYLLGSIPTGFIVARARGLDIRRVGSGNIGATNVLRALGKPAGVFVLLADGLKGFLASSYLVHVAGLVLGNRAVMGEAGHEYLSIAAGLAAMLGHIYTCWLGFRGGKGIATAAGVLAAWVPWTLVAGLATWILVALLSRYVSLASIAAAVSLPLSTWIIGHYSHRYITVTGLMAALAILKHKGNIQRLLQGTEHRFSLRNPPNSAPQKT
jgi:glycerol-3-phosphate acyltransferase PlsY